MSMKHGLCRWFATLVTIVWCCAVLPGMAEDVSLLDLAAADAGVKTQPNGGSAEVVETDSGRVLAVTVGEQGGDYPGVNLQPKDGPWNLSQSRSVAFELFNPSEATIRVHGRVDNKGDWRKQPWSVNAVTLKPGASATLTVPFGKQYGNPAFALNPSAISQAVVFVERPKSAVTFHVKSIKSSGKPAAAGTGTTPGPPGAADAGIGAAAGVAPTSNTLYDFDTDFDESLLETDNTSYELVSGEKGRALRVKFNPGTSYPGIKLKAPGNAWDLTNFAGVEAKLKNAGTTPATVVVRIDNPGDWKKNPWNAEKTHLKPGEAKTVRVKFGQSWGSPGFALNPAAVPRTLIYVEYPKAEAVIDIEHVTAYGQATVREVDTVDLEGKLFDFGPDFVLGGRVEERGATAAVVDGRLELTYSTSEQWPAAALKPVAKRWDLSNFEGISAQVTNLTDQPARIAMRVDNPGANGNANCNTEVASIAPGKTQTITVTFGQSWGKPAFTLDSANVVALLFIAENPKHAVKLAVDNVVANRKAYAELPEWLGKRPPVEGDWVQTLAEEFEGSTLNEELWTPRLVWDGPNPAETQRYREDNVKVEDGKLVIICEKNPGHQYDNPSLPTREYATGAVTSFDKWTQAYGYFEARIKRPTARGLWPAFWMMPDRGEGNGDIWARRDTGRGGMEIDIWEHLTEWGPNRYNAAAHWDGYGSGHKQWGNAGLYHLPNPDGWNTFGLLWEPGKLTWFCDGKKMLEWENERITSHPNYLKFTVQMGNWATRNVDDAALPDRFEIDYVRCWQLRERVKQ